MKRHPLDISYGVPVCAKAERTPVRIKLLVIVKQNVRFQHGRAGIAVVSDGQCVRSKSLSEDSARKRHRIDAVARGNGRGRVHHSAELNVAQHLIPHVESGSCGHVPGSVPIGKRAVRIA